MVGHFSRANKGKTVPRARERATDTHARDIHTTRRGCAKSETPLSLARWRPNVTSMYSSTEGKMKKREGMALVGQNAACVCA